MKKTTPTHFFLRNFLALVAITGSVLTSIAQCPTANASQSFCDVEAPTIADLSATDAGGGITWYASATSTTPLSNATGLTNNTAYYADNSSGNCGSRTKVNVTIYGAPAGLSFQGVCVDHPNEATISDLFVIGNDIKWYKEANGGTALPVSTVLENDTFYYVNQANPDTGCRTSRRSVFVSVGVIPVPEGDSVQEFCSAGQPTVADLTASGINNWYLTESSATPLESSTPLIDGHTYFATNIDPPCESLDRLKVTVELKQPNNSGNYGEIEICETGVTATGTVNLYEALLGTPDATGTWSGPIATANDHIGTVDVTTLVAAGSPYVFTYKVISDACPPSETSVNIFIRESANPGTNGSLAFCINDAPQNLFDSLEGTPDPGGIWSPALASGNGVFDPTKDAPGEYTYTVQGVPPCGEASATVTVTVNPEAQPGTNGTLNLCENSSPENLFNSLGGTPDSGGTWTPALASGTGLFDPLKDSAGEYTYNVEGITPCGSATSTVTVNVTPLPDAGSDATLELCSNDDPQNLFDFLGGTPIEGGSWSPALASGTGVFDPKTDTSGLYKYTLKSTAPCIEATATVNVIVNPEAQPGTNGQLALCENSMPEDLFDSLGGNPEAGGTWSPALASGTGLFDPTKDIAGTYTYNVAGITPCGNAESMVTVTIDLLADAGIDGSLELCSDAIGLDLFDSLGGTPQTGGTWSPALTSGTGIFDPANDAAGIYTYTVTGAASCGEDSATVTATIIPQADPGINGILKLCEESTNLEDLFLSLGGTPETGGVWSPALASGSSVFDPTIDLPGTYTYTITGTTPCGDPSATVEVIIASVPDAGSGGRLAICGNAEPQDLFESLGGTPEPGGTWSPALASGTGVFNPALDPANTYTYTVTTPCGTASAKVSVSLIPPPSSVGLTLSSPTICLEEDAQITLSGASQLEDGNYNLTYSISGANISEKTVSITIVDGSATLNVPASELTNLGTSVISVLNISNPVSQCGTAPNSIPTAQIIVEEAQTPQLLPKGETFCDADVPTLVDLNKNLAGTDNITWYDAQVDGNLLPEDTILIDGTTYFALNATANGCSNGIFLAVTVRLEECEPPKIVIPDGFSPNGDTINDEFLIKNLRELYPNFQLQIYNRYGNILYKGNKNTQNWDGTSNQGREIGNGILPVGVYFYILELNDDTNTKPIQGSVYLSR